MNTPAIRFISDEKYIPNTKENKINYEYTYDTTICFSIYTRGKRLKTFIHIYIRATRQGGKRNEHPMPPPPLRIHSFVTCHAKNLNLNLNHFKDFAIGYSLPLPSPAFAVSLSCFNFAFDSWSKYGSGVCAFSAFYMWIMYVSEWIKSAVQFVIKQFVIYGN